MSLELHFDQRLAEIWLFLCLYETLSFYCAPFYTIKVGSQGQQRPHFPFTLPRSMFQKVNGGGTFSGQLLLQCPQSVVSREVCLEDNAED